MAPIDETSASARDEASTELVGGLLSDARDLVSAHADVLQHDVRTGLDRVQRGIRRTGAMAAVAVLAGLLLSQAIAFGLSAATALPLWASLAIVGAVIALAGYAACRRPGDPAA